RAAIYTLSLHDALPICRRRRLCPKLRSRMRASRLAATSAILLTACLALGGCGRNGDAGGEPVPGDDAGAGRVTVEGDDRIADSRSEEHTSELQSRENLV